jgi:hypothetical protein
LHSTLKFLDETRGLAGGFRDARIDDQGREIGDGSKRWFVAE